MPFFQAPVASHVCGVIFEHCLVVGTHTPVQVLPMQTKGQTAVSIQLPLALHVCWVLPLQVVSPGEHVPVQLPVAHRYMQT